MILRLSAFVSLCIMKEECLLRRRGYLRNHLMRLHSHTRSLGDETKTPARPMITVTMAMTTPIKVKISCFDQRSECAPRARDGCGKTLSCSGMTTFSYSGMTGLAKALAY
jgi:hypothetical protein